MDITTSYNIGNKVWFLIAAGSAIISGTITAIRIDITMNGTALLEEIRYVITPTDSTVKVGKYIRTAKDLFPSMSSAAESTYPSGSDNTANVKLPLKTD